VGNKEYEIINQSDSKTKTAKLFGFRSGKWHKKVIAVIYLIFAAVISIGFILTIHSVEDALIAAETTISAFVPFVLLSDFNIRNRLPLFKRHKAGYSILGMICVYIIIGTIFTLINPALYAE